MDNPKLRRGLDKLTSSLNQIGDTFEKAFEVLFLLLSKSFRFFILLVELLPCFSRMAEHSLRTKQLISSRKHENFKPDEEELVVKMRIRINLMELVAHGKSLQSSQCS